jgi:hypothetical protein
MCTSIRRGATSFQTVLPAFPSHLSCKITQRCSQTCKPCRSSRSTPPPLSLLTEIPDAAWESLLPQLVEDDTAASVALCCKRLRHQVQRGTQKLTLSFQPESAVEGLDALPERFPGCTTVQIYAGVQQQVPVLAALPLLARGVARSPVPVRHCTALHCTALHCTALHCTAPFVLVWCSPALISQHSLPTFASCAVVYCMHLGPFLLLEPPLYVTCCGARTGCSYAKLLC